MATLVIAEHSNTELKPATLHAVTAAQQLGADVHVLVAGAGCSAVVDAAARIAGVSKVLVADNAAYATQLAENTSALIAEVAAGYDAVLAAATAGAKNVMPRVAALLDVAVAERVHGSVELCGGESLSSPSRRLCLSCWSWCERTLLRVCVNSGRRHGHAMSWWRPERGQ